MDKKIPQNKKYANVESKLDTGMTVNKVKFISNSEYSKKRDEIFFRLTKTQLYDLYSEYEADEYEDIAETEASYGGPRIVTYSEGERAVYSKPYLILDIRDTPEFNEYHLLQARHYPSVMMRRDQVHPEMAKFRNKEGHLIIIASGDERSGCEAAKVLVDRGTDNIFLLTCPVREFAEHYPSFVEV
jgi:centrosomal protein CEP41